MSATLIHHGHIRLLKLAKEMGGNVIVGLTTDDEILNQKGYRPELNFSERKEVLSAIKFVDEIIPSPWLINDDFLLANSIDYLVHGEDNSNDVNKSKLLILPRTQGVSSSLMRAKVLKSVAMILEIKK